MPITLDEMARLVRALEDADAEVAEQTAVLKRLAERARVFREETIPSAMQELGLAQLKLDTGETITVKQDVYASVPRENRDRAYQWLEDHGHGGLIKLTVATAFGRKESDEAVELYNKLAAEGVNPTLQQTVAPQTLKAFLREQIAAGEDVPLDLFGARPVWTTKVKK